MAQKHHSLQMTELADLTDLVLGFQEQNRVKCWWRFNVEMTEKHPEVYLTVECWGLGVDTTAAPPLASVSVRCWGMNLRAWNAVLTHALYALDFRLALNELEGVKVKGA